MASQYWYKLKLKIYLLIVNSQDCHDLLLGWWYTWNFSCDEKNYLCSIREGGFSSGVCIFPWVDEKNNAIHSKEHNTTHIDITRISHHHLNGTQLNEIEFKFKLNCIQMKFQLKRNEMQISAKVLKICSSSFMAMVLEKNNFEKTQIKRTPFHFLK
jgi:hypothetical protein